MTDKIFHKCVRLLEKAAAGVGVTYESINVWVFCVIWPLVTAGLIVLLIIK